MNAKVLTELPKLPSNAIELAGAYSLCSHNCGLLFDVKDNEIVTIKADPDNPATKGYSCSKAYAIKHYVKHEQRVTQPLKRMDDGRYQAMEWDQAIAEIAAKLKFIASNYAPRSIANVFSGQGNHLAGGYATSIIMAVDSATHFNALGQEKTQHALVNQWMFDAPPDCFYYPDEERCDFFDHLWLQSLD